ncbi:TFIIB-type zinc ribbon-containing protein [Methanosphaera sp. ISO3-F5]|uniref:TFIIB-type zinc ribbon-containing protein n=1 Tax=Methanosphaera sp. ISO3-F5 TaxID=1452353 RepID=UPI0039648906
MNKKLVCPECNGNIFHEDTYRGETSCRQCGLVLVAPLVNGFVFPGFRVVPQQKKIIISIRLLSSRAWRVGYDIS